MSTVSPGSNLFQQESLRAISDHFHNEGLKQTTSSMSNPDPGKSPDAVDPTASSAVAGEQPQSAILDPIDPNVASINTEAAALTATDVDMASFFSIDNLEISKDEDGKTTVDGVSFSPAENTEDVVQKAKKETLLDSPDAFSTPQKLRSKSEALDTHVQKPKLQAHASSVPHSPLARPLRDKSSTLQALAVVSSDNPRVPTSKSDVPRVSAYARLDFPSFTFYVQTLQVILGRRPENGASVVDVDLGVAKAISRRHAKIFYNFGSQQFELSVLGRNGAFVDDSFVDHGSTVLLKNK